MFSQNDEERFIVDYFDDATGRFLDIGAWEGSRFSNTHQLALSGWSGVCVEASPAACAKLLELYARNPRVEIVNAAIDPQSGWALFHDAGGDGVSTLKASHRAKWAGVASYRALHVWTVTPAEIAWRFRDKPFDFVSLDIEGANFDVLEFLPLSEMGTRLLCVEHDGRCREVIEYCAEHGLTEQLLHNSENLILAKPK